ncbi:MAG: hypothetical protein HYT29_01015 [Parcubacteria group bacterium]|nr:hypothetical protein [Parcubacteria group bacterium]
MSSRTHKITAYLLVLLFAAIPFGVLGQALPGFGGNITLTVTPEFPRANDQVTVSARGFSVDLDRAEVSWYLNGKLEKKAVGGATFSFRAGALGKTSSLTILVDSPTQGTFRETLAVRPAEVDILWESRAYTPPFYKGKSLLPSSETVTLTAMPTLVAGNGRALDGAALVYSWEQDGRKLLSESGFGKRTATITGPLLFQESIISLEVSSLDKSLVARRTIVLAPVEPKIIFYEKHPLRGILYARALENIFTLLKEEFVLRAEPFFFSKSAEKTGAPRFSWTVNSATVLPQEINELILRHEGDESGSSRVGLVVKDEKKILQAAASLLVQY